jgi:hypothetical protein
MCAATQTIAPAASCNLYIVFTPSVLGTRSVNLALSSNAPDLTLLLVGVGISASEPVSAAPIPTLSERALALLSILMIAVVALRRR